MSVNPEFFDEITHYAQHITANPDLLNRLCEQYFLDVTTSSIPLLHLFNNLPAEEIKKQTDSSMLATINLCAQGKSQEAAMQISRNWQMGKYSHIPQEQVKLPDILRFNQLRKNTLLSLAPTYTTDLGKFTRLVHQLDAFSNLQNEEAVRLHLALEEEMLYHEKEFSTSIINNSVNGILAFDTKLNILEWNPVMERWHGLSKEEVLGRKIFEVFSGYKDAEEGRAILGALRGEQIFISERPFFKGEGFYEASIIPLYTAEDHINGGVAIIHETTHRKEAEQEIKEKNEALATALLELQSASEELKSTNKVLEHRVIEKTAGLAEQENFLRSFIKQSPVSTWILDPHGKLLQLNKASERLFNIVHPEAFISRYNMLQDPSLQAPDSIEQVRAVFEVKKVATFHVDYDLTSTTAMQAAPNASAMLIFTVFPILDARGNVSHVVAQHVDISEIKKAEAARAQSEEQLKLVTDAVPVLISYIDKNRKFSWVNLEYERWYLQKREEIIGRYMWEVLGEKPYQNISYMIDKALAGERVHDEAYQDYGGDIGRKHISATLIPHVVGQEVKGVFTLVSDVSEQKNNEEMLEALYEEVSARNEELNRINTDLDNFFYTASHDLKSPISNLEGLLSLIKREVKPSLNEREGKLLDLFGNSIAKLKNTIEELISLTRIQKISGNQGQQEVRVAEVVQDVKEDLRPLLEKSNPQIKSCFEPETIVYARSHLRSILYNLLSNALKYRFPDRQLIIELETFIENDWVVLRVQDNGLGMTPTQLNKLFSRFIRMHTHVEGTGIGLYTIKRIVENKGGSIQVNSEATKGTEFKVYLSRLAE